MRPMFVYEFLSDCIFAKSSKDSILAQQPDGNWLNLMEHMKAITISEPKSNEHTTNNLMMFYGIGKEGPN